MSTGKTVSVVEKLRADYAAAQAELKGIVDRERELQWRVEYIASLLSGVQCDLDAPVMAAMKQVLLIEGKDLAVARGGEKEKTG